MNNPIPRKRIGTFLPCLSFTPDNTEEINLDKTKSVTYTIQIVARNNSEKNTYELIIQNFREAPFPNI